MLILITAGLQIQPSRRALPVGVVTLGQPSAACERNASSAEVATIGCYFTLSTEGSAGDSIRCTASCHKEQRVELTDIEWVPWVVGLDGCDEERHRHLPRLTTRHDLFPVLLSHGCHFYSPASHSYRVRASGGNGRLAVNADEYVVTCFHNLTTLLFLRVLVVLSCDSLRAKYRFHVELRRCVECCRRCPGVVKQATIAGPH